MIICSFFGTGKTTLAKSRGGFIDLERYIFQDRTDMFRNAVSEYINEYGYVVLVNCTDLVLTELKGYNKVVVVPSKDQKMEYIKRYIDRGSSEDWITKNIAHFEEQIDRAMEEDNVYILKSGQWLGNVIDEIISNNSSI